MKLFTSCSEPTWLDIAAPCCIAMLASATIVLLDVLDGTPYRTILLVAAIITYFGKNIFLFLRGR